MDPVQIDVLSALTMSMGCTVNSPVSGTQSELLTTNLNFTLPWPIRLTAPDGFTVATAGLVLIQCPKGISGKRNGLPTQRFPPDKFVCSF